MINLKLTGFTASLFLHGVLLFTGGMVLIKSVDYGVQKGDSGLVVNLVAAPSEPEPVAPPEPITEPESIPIEQPKPVQKPQEPPKEHHKEKQSGKDKVTAQSSGGAISEAKPDYLKNPAPPYPMQARRKGWEGTVIIRVLVDKDGHAHQAEIIKSSGHKILDEEALKAVKTWSFRPAKLGLMPVESQVQVPVRFSLRE